MRRTFKEGYPRKLAVCEHTFDDAWPVRTAFRNCSMDAAHSVPFFLIIASNHCAARTTVACTTQKTS
eukprot:2567897-Rhodomonas_salina.3